MAVKKNERLPLGVNRAPAVSLRLPLFTVKKYPNTLGGNRFAFIVSSKVSKKATERNKIKRQLYANLIGWPRKSADYVFIVNPTAAKATKTELKQSIAKIKDL